MNENRINADAFACWYVKNKPYLRNILMRTYTFDEDILSNVFFSIYSRILNEGISIKDYTPYMLRAFKYRYLTYRKKASRLVLVEDYNQLQNSYYYESY
ncbi:hypothetical protein D0T84_16365 [Dysgonomonas sp. 521]|uniref:hypothetical protein n=1 Tax=Dysgonomonas sp. 521 TaxID=2302932 RepID=UPI0013D4B56D|nr:hypothetical protein [Dysgonomonas sp. 521]NDV96476.1 hypothetical protein [Dysgonomonas sp. 521]